MSVEKILLFPDQRLSHVCSPIRLFDTSLKNLLQTLFDTLHAGPGVGLAAPQIGIAKRVSVIDISRSKKTARAPSPCPDRPLRYALVNPILLKGEGIQTPREGCLSVPDMLANVRRYQKVTVRCWNENGSERLIYADGFEALALQHEMDHLDGKLFLDRVANLRTDVFRRKNY